MEIELHQIDLRYTALRIDDLAQRTRLGASLLEQGQLSPVLVIETESDRYVLIDGYARVRVLGELGRDVVDAIVLDLAERDALLEALRQRSPRKRSALEEGWLLDELSETHGLSLRVLAERLQRSKSWVSRRIALVRALPDVALDAVRHARISPQAATRYLVPLARANSEHCVLLIENLGTTRVSVRQMQRLYLDWRVADVDQKRNIVEHPLLYLKTQRVLAANDGTETPDEPELISDLRLVCRVCRRLRQRLSRGESEMLGEFRPFLSTTWRATQTAFDALSSAMPDPEE